MFARLISFLVLILALLGNVKAAKYISLGNQIAETNLTQAFLVSTNEVEKISDKSLQIPNPGTKWFSPSAQVDIIHSNYSLHRLTLYFSSRLKMEA